MTTEAEPLAAAPAGSITAWTRLEPRIASADLRESTAARIADPAWLLCRQWQLGEFDGSDGGSPVSARLRTQTAPTRYYRGMPDPAAAQPAQAYDPAVLPLETLVERAPDSGNDLSLRCDGGRQFLRCLAHRGVAGYGAAFTTAFPLPGAPGGPAVDTATADRLLLLAGRVPDATALATALVPAAPGGQPRIPAAVSVSTSDTPAVRAAAQDFLTHWAGLVSRPAPDSSPWVPNRLEHRFGIATELVDNHWLAGREYRGGDLDWSDLTSRWEPDGWPAGGEQPQTVRTVLPAPVRYPGMPVDRWWGFEDAHVSFAGAEAGAPDLARLLMLEFATLYGNDWFVIPVELPVGTLTQIDSLVVTDTFGTKVLTGQSYSGWSMFACGLNRFCLPPVLADSMRGPAVEDVLFLRDEGANVAWAVEQTVEGALGTAVDRHEAHLAALRAAPAAAAPAGTPADLAYRVRSDLPPAHWIPLLPEAAPDGPRLRRSALRPPGGGPIQPAGQLLGQTPWISAEEVPAEGVRVTRSWQRARWSDGSTHLWQARRREVGRGEANSGLRHDLLTRRDTTG